MFALTRAFIELLGTQYTNKNTDIPPSIRQSLLQAISLPAPETFIISAHASLLPDQNGVQIAIPFECEERAILLLLFTPAMRAQRTG